TEFSARLPVIFYEFEIPFFKELIFNPFQYMGINKLFEQFWKYWFVCVMSIAVKNLVSIIKFNIQKFPERIFIFHIWVFISTVCFAEFLFKTSHVAHDKGIFHLFNKISR